jgi:hypothetical protein
MLSLDSRRKCISGLLKVQQGDKRFRVASSLRSCRHGSATKSAPGRDSPILRMFGCPRSPMTSIWKQNSEQAGGAAAETRLEAKEASPGVKPYFKLLFSLNADCRPPQDVGALANIASAGEARVLSISQVLACKEPEGASDRACPFRPSFATCICNTCFAQKQVSVSQYSNVRGYLPYCVVPGILYQPRLPSEHNISVERRSRIWSPEHVVAFMRAS